MLVLLALLLTVVPTVGWSANFQDCRGCHQNELSEAEIRLVQHEPFMQKNCAACHATVAPESGLLLKTTSAKKKSRAARKVTWLTESSQLSNEHGFVLPGNKLGHKLIIDLRGEQVSYPRQQIELPLLRDLQEARATKAAPEISAVKVLEVKRGVFLSVLIGWKTNVLSDAQVYYGEQDLSQRSDRSKRFGRTHHIRLYNLSPDKNYQFKVVNHDLFGGVKESEVFNFSTGKPFELKSTVEASGSEIDVQSTIQRIGKDYLVQLKTDKPAAVFVGSVGDLRVQQVEPALKATNAADLAHDGLSTGIELGIVACRNCHRKQQQATHPVNVLPKPGMTIPSDYPTLADGRISCASCHLTHSSDNEFLAIRRGKRELCVGCHKDML